MKTYTYRAVLTYTDGGQAYLTTGDDSVVAAWISVYGSGMLTNNVVSVLMQQISTHNQRNNQ